MHMHNHIQYIKGAIEVGSLVCSNIIYKTLSPRIKPARMTVVQGLMKTAVILIAIGLIGTVEGKYIIINIRS